MNRDQYGLPIQSDGDANDQLQRTGFALIAYGLGSEKTNAWSVTDFYYGLIYLLQGPLGIWRRHAQANPNNCSADQIIASIGACIVWQEINTTAASFAQMLKRFGFAQNYKDGLSNDTQSKIPDFMFFRAMPLFCRMGWAGYPFAVVFDFYLLALALGDWVYLKTEHDPVDINNTLLTIIICQKIYPTPFSIAAYWLWPKLRPTIKQDLARYHRAEAGGNPEMAELWFPLIDEMTH
jgi:hypothetical protein